MCKVLLTVVVLLLLCFEKWRTEKKNGIDSQKEESIPFLVLGRCAFGRRSAIVKIGILEP